MKRLLAALGAAILLAASAYGQDFDAKNFTAYSSTCTSSASIAAAARYRNAITMTVPVGGATVFVGPLGVTTSTGFPIAAGGAFTLSPYSGPVYCVVSSGSQALNIAETF